MTNHYVKIDLPVSKVRRYLKPGPIVLVSSASGGNTNIMSSGWWIGEVTSSTNDF